MALVLNEEQQMLRDAARDFLSERAPISHLREIRDSGNKLGLSRELWAEMVEMGWAAILVPEEHGGLGFGYSGLGLILEESGRTLTPSPLLGTALTGAAALLIGGSPEQKAAVLPALAAGERILSLACDETSCHQPERVATRAESHGDGYRLNGAKTAVIDGAAADTFIVSSATRDGISLFLVPAAAAGVTVEPYPALDICVAATVTFEQVDLPADALLGQLHQGRTLLDRILDTARIGASAELLGIAQIRTRHCTVLTSGIYLFPPDWATLAEVIAGDEGQVEFLAGFNASIGCLSGAGAQELASRIPESINLALRDHLSGFVSDSVRNNGA